VIAVIGITFKNKKHLRMKLKFVIPAVLIAGAAGVLAFVTLKKDSPPSDKDELIVNMVGQVLEKWHYEPKKIDDSFSKEVFDKYIDNLDGEKKFFISPDIDYLKRYETSIDDEIKGQESLGFLNDADSILDIRLKQAEKIYPAILEKPFNFNENDSIQLSRDKLNFPADSAALREVWYKMLKYRTLTKLTELQKEQEQAVDTASIKKENITQLETDARKQVKKIYDLYFDRLRSHFTEKERFSAFMNAITGSMDPHTNYFSPLDKRYFDEQMSGTFYGIGALLRQDEDKVKIENIVTGGPAWKEGQLKAGDIILKVGQGDEQPVDMTGFTTEDAVKLIRGSKGTMVKLTVKHLDGTVETIAITRGEVKIEDTFARSYLINNDKHKIGYIVLPEFYFNKSGVTGPGSSAFDVGQEIKKLKAVGVEGIILDLRFNGGGSLSDAIDMAGLFVPKGPVVQVRSRDGDVNVLQDHFPDVAYKGPLAIMVNEYSASASEILAAAMQDYKRAVIIGSTETYGKGTVQRMVDLSDLLPQSQKKVFGPLGALKLTIQKFYRISGGSTQLKGVSSDIVLPDPYYDIAERTDKDALPWDQIKKADYAEWTDPANVDYLRKRSEVRLENDQAFKMIDANIAVLKRINDEKKMPLNLNQYIALQDANDSALKKVDEVKKLIKPLNISNLNVDISSINTDSIKAGRNRELLKAYRTDPYLNEATRVMEDMISGPTMQNGKLTKAKEAESY
jgi:carboxyl-terminal processing protease